MGLIKLNDMGTIPLTEVKWKLDKKIGKTVFNTNEIEEEISSDSEEINEATWSYFRQYDQGCTSYQRPRLRPREFMEKKERFGNMIMHQSPA